jgi:hypothetical protein
MPSCRLDQAGLEITMRYLAVGILAVLAACGTPEDQARMRDFSRYWMLSHPQQQPQPIYAQPMPAYQPLPQTTTNCQRIGNSINCQSY